MWSTSQGVQAAPASWEKQAVDSPLEPPEGTQQRCPTWGLLTSRTVKYSVLSPATCVLCYNGSRKANRPLMGHYPQLGKHWLES